MGAHEYLEKYVRSMPGGSIAWERSIFSRSGQWNPVDLIDAAVDIAWDAFTGATHLERAGIEILQNGNYLVISPLTVKNNNFLAMAA